MQGFRVRIDFTVFDVVDGSQLDSQNICKTLLSEKINAPESLPLDSALLSDGHV